MSEWRELYNSKLITEEEAVRKIKSGDRIFAISAFSMPTNLLELLADRKDELTDVTVIGSTALYPYKILQSPDYFGKINYISNFLNGFDNAFKNVGNVIVNSVPFSRIAESVIHSLHANVLMAECSPPDEEGYLYFGVSGTCVGWEVAQAVELIILQVNRYQVKTAGERHRLHVSDVDWLVEYDTPLPDVPQPIATSEELQIADYILPLIQDGSTIQLGIGGLQNAIGYRLESKKNLGIYTEMYIDAMAYLAQRGVITGRQVAAFAFGSQPMYKYLAEGFVEMLPLSAVNDPYEMSKIDKLVSINSCLMADLTGQICSESIGHLEISGVGGQLDFVRGASLSSGGKSFLCMTSQYKDKYGNMESRIRLNLPPGAAITTPRCDVMYVVTEYGVADLWLKPIPARVEAMLSIAHPNYREPLREQAIKMGLIKEQTR